MLSRSMISRVFLFVFAGLTLALPARGSGVEAGAPAGGGLSALTVKIDLPKARVSYEACSQAPCAVGPQSASVPITLDPASLPDAKDVSLEVLAIGAGRSVIHVRIPSRGETEPLSPAWEGLFAGRATPASSGDPLFAGITGFTRGEPGERSGTVLRTVVDGATQFLVQGEVQENLRICGDDASLLKPQGLDAPTLVWRFATLQRLPMSRRNSAIRLVASLRGGAPADPPLAMLLAAEGASTAIGDPKSLSDGDPETTWSEARTGQGQGEFVLFHAPHEVPLTRFAIAVAPKVPKPAGAAPRTFYLATDAALFEVTMPEDAWAHPGAAYDVPLPEPVTTSCVALVLGDAYMRGNASADVTVAELYAYSAFDSTGAQLDSVAQALAGGGPRAEAAAGVLKRARAAGLDAVALVYPKLDTAGRALAVDVAASAPSCTSSSRLLAHALSDADEVVREKARAKLEQPHCGRDAVPELVAALDAPETRARAATVLASVAPSKLLEPLAKVLGQGSPRERAQLRNAFAHAAEQAIPTELAALLSQARAPGARIELLRASASKLGEVREAADRALDEILAATSTGPARYVLASPIAALARVGDATAEARLVSWLEHDEDVLVRVRAAELAGASAKTQAALDGAEKDPEPRVREAALRTVGAARVAGAQGGAIAALEGDPWTFVRAEAAGALAALPASPVADDALSHAVKDKVPRVRAAAIVALSGHGAAAYAGTIRGRLEDRHEDLDVRVAAAHALGTLCDAHAVDALADYAVEGASSPDPNDVALGLAATEALGQLHPADLASRFKKIRGKGTRPDAQRAADAAIAARGVCR
jgi:HEAT repeat protein